MTLNSIDVKQFKFKYDDNQDNYTLDDLSFHVKQSEWLSIIGHNGSGKSTTVRLIDGLLAAESGDIFVEKRTFNGRQCMEHSSEDWNGFSESG